MSERLTHYDFSKPSIITASDRMNYPWDEWFDGGIWRIEQGVDFKTHPLMMERIIRTRATARKAKIVLRHEPRPGTQDPFGYIVFQRTDVPHPVPHRHLVAAGTAVANGSAQVVRRSKRPVRPHES